MKEAVVIIFLLIFSSCGEAINSASESNNNDVENKAIPDEKKAYGYSDDTTECGLFTFENEAISKLISYGKIGEGERIVDTTIIKSINKLFKIDIGIYESYRYQQVNDFLLFNLIHRKNNESRYILFTTNDSLCVIDTLSIIERYQPPFVDGKRFSQFFFHDRKSGLYIEVSYHEPKFQQNRVFHPEELRKVGQQFFHLKDGKFKLIEFIPKD